VAYAREISSYIEAAKQKSKDKGLSLDFGAAQAAATRFSTAADHVHGLQMAASGDLAKLNVALRQAEADLLSGAGLPNRPWFRHTIFAPGEYTGYAAVVIPGVNEAIDSKDQQRAAQQLTVLTQALTRAAQTLEGTR
jgi:N-acetylated-alpha-linked acidic dipeptidase